MPFHGEEGSLLRLAFGVWVATAWDSLGLVPDWSLKGILTAALYYLSVGVGAHIQVMCHTVCYTVVTSVSIYVLGGYSVFLNI